MSLYRVSEAMRGGCERFQYAKVASLDQTSATQVLMMIDGATRLGSGTPYVSLLQTEIYIAFVSALEFHLQEVHTDRTVLPVMNPNTSSPWRGCLMRTHSWKEAVDSFDGLMAALTCLAAE